MLYLYNIESCVLSNMLLIRLAERLRCRYSSFRLTMTSSASRGSDLNLAIMTNTFTKWGPTAPGASWEIIRWAARQKNSV